MKKREISIADVVSVARAQVVDARSIRDECESGTQEWKSFHRAYLGRRDAFDALNAFVQAAEDEMV